jgi:hypothetical protein
MMKKDERVIADVNIAKSVGYMVFWIGIFIVLLYRWFMLEQTFLETFDFFFIWFVASLVQFFTLALKGIPITYPISMSSKEQYYYVFIVPLLTGVLTSAAVILKVGIDLQRIILGFVVSFVTTILLFLLYRVVLSIWEKRNI